MSTASLASQFSAAIGSQAVADPPSTIRSGEDTLAHTPGEFNRLRQFATARVLPDPESCLARDAGLPNYADCLVDSPYQCPYALRFGWGFFCRHPERSEIAKRTASQGR
jgi:hypothetical protein